MAITEDFYATNPSTIIFSEAEALVLTDSTFCVPANTYYEFYANLSAGTTSIQAYVSSLFLAPSNNPSGKLAVSGVPENI